MLGYFLQLMLIIMELVAPPLRTKGSAHSRHELQARASGEKPQIYT